MAILLQSASGGGKGMEGGIGAGVLSHIVLRNSALTWWGGLSQSVHDTLSHRRSHSSRDLVDKIECRMAVTYKESFPKVVKNMIKTEKSLARLSDNCNKSHKAKTLRPGIGKNCKQMQAVAGQLFNLRSDLLSHDPDRPPAASRFDQSRVRAYLEKLKGDVSWNRAREILPFTQATVGHDRGDDPHISKFTKIPPKNIPSSSRDLFYKHLVKGFNAEFKEELDEQEIDIVHCWDPEFALNTVAVTASNFDEVRNYVSFIAVWHLAGHYMKDGFALPGNLVNFWVPYFTGPVRYRADHFKKSRRSLLLKAEAVKSKVAQVASVGTTSGVQSSMPISDTPPNSGGEGVDIANTIDAGTSVDVDNLGAEGAVCDNALTSAADGRPGASNTAGLSASTYRSNDELGAEEVDIDDKLDLFGGFPDEADANLEEFRVVDGPMASGDEQYSSEDGHAVVPREADHQEVLHPVVTVADIAGMKVQELKEQLKARGLKSSGLKKDLCERLQAALCSESSLSGSNGFVPEGSPETSGAYPPRRIIASQTLQFSFVLRSSIQLRFKNHHFSNYSVS